MKVSKELVLELLLLIIVIALALVRFTYFEEGERENGKGEIIIS